MNEELLKYLKEHNMEEILKRIILPQYYYGSPCQEYIIDLNKSAINDENLTIRIDKFLDTHIEFDDKTDLINDIIYNKKINNGDEFDKEILYEELEKIGFKVDAEGSNYTYNYDNDLNRDFTFTIFELDGGNDDYVGYGDCDQYCLLSIHYGKDARWGFSDTVCCKIRDIDYFILGTRIQGYTDNIDYEGGYMIEENCTYDKENNVWIDNETKKIIRLYSSADGF